MGSGWRGPEIVAPLRLQVRLQVWPRNRVAPLRLQVPGSWGQSAIRVRLSCRDPRPAFCSSSVRSSSRARATAPPPRLVVSGWEGGDESDGDSSDRVDANLRALGGRRDTGGQ
eukprot:scaffold27039_cov96-Isochrysis_galbana.AAC.1